MLIYAYWFNRVLKFIDFISYKAFLDYILDFQTHILFLRLASILLVSSLCANLSYNPPLQLWLNWGLPLHFHAIYKYYIWIIIIEHIGDESKFIFCKFAKPHRTCSRYCRLQIKYYAVLEIWFVGQKFAKSLLLEFLDLKIHFFSFFIFSVYFFLFSWKNCQIGPKPNVSEQIKTKKSTERRKSAKKG